MRATNIDWDINNEDIFCYLADFNSNRADLAEVLNVPVSEIPSRMEARFDYLKDRIHHCPALIYDLWDLPEEVELPEAAEEWEDGEIADYLSDTFGFCLNGFDLSDRDNTKEF